MREGSAEEVLSLPIYPELRGDEQEGDHLRDDRVLCRARGAAAVRRRPEIGGQLPHENPLAEGRGGQPQKGFRSTRIRPFDLSEHEQTVLQRWALDPGRLGRRARIILAAERGDSPSHIAASSGVHRSVVYCWCDRFRINRLQALASNMLVEGLTADDRRELEKWVGGLHDVLAQRAKFILALADAHSLRAAALASAINLNTAQNWRKAFTQAGIRGLARSRSSTRAARLHGLGVEETAALSARAASGNERSSRRARIILALAAGQLPQQVAAAVGVSRQTVFTWLNRYLVQGLGAFTAKSREKARKKQAKQRQISDVLATRELAARSDPPRRDIATLPLVFSMSLPVDLQSEASGTRVRGTTTILTSRWFAAHFELPGEPGVVSAGDRVSVEIHWPALRSDACRPILHVKGRVVDREASFVSVSIRSFAFTSRP